MKYEAMENLDSLSSGVFLVITHQPLGSLWHLWFDVCKVQLATVNLQKKKRKEEKPLGLLKHYRLL